MADFPTFFRDIEVEPGMRIDQIHTRQFALEFDGLAKVVLCPAVMGKRDRGKYQDNGQWKSSVHGLSPDSAGVLLPAVYDFNRIAVKGVPHDTAISQLALCGP